MNKVKSIAIPIVLAGTVIGGAGQVVADVPITRQSHDFLKINDNQGVIQSTLSRMTSVNVGIESVAEKPVPPQLYRGGSPVSRPNCGMVPDKNWPNVGLAKRAIIDCFDGSTYSAIQNDLAHLIQQTSARSGYYSYTEPVTINSEDRYFQVGVFLRANQSPAEAKRIGINISPSDSAKNIYAIYEQPESLVPIGEEMLMPGAGKLKIYTMDGVNPDSGLKPVHTEVTDEFAVVKRTASDYAANVEQTFYDRTGALKAIHFLAQYMDEYSSELAILDYGNPISPLLVEEDPDPDSEVEDLDPDSDDMVPDIKIETPERWYSRNECTMDNATYGQRNLTELGTTYKRDRYIIDGDAELARNATLGTSAGSYEGEEYTRYVVNPESRINTIEDIFDFESFRGEDPVMLTTEHLNAYNYDYNKPISDFTTHITDPYNEYSQAPNNLFRIDADDPFNNIPAADYQPPADVIDDSIVKVEYDVYNMVEEGYYSTRSRTETQTYTEEEEQCEIEEQCEMVTVTKTRNVTITENGKYETTTAPWTYTNWVPPVYEKDTNTACIHNTQEQNFCDTYNCGQTYPEKDNQGYITDENLAENQVESFYWTTGNWSGCDGACGIGTETRTVTCVSTFGGSVDSANCTEPKPDSERPCKGSGANCSFEWKTSNWSKCSEVCDGGFKIRDVYCQAPSGERVPENRCDAGDKPNAQTVCNDEKACSYDWNIDIEDYEPEWSSCVSNSSCQQTQFRTICYGGWGKNREPRCYSYKPDTPTAKSTGWLGNKTTTLTGTRSDGFNGSHFVCTTSYKSNCTVTEGYGKNEIRRSGTRTSTTRHGQQSRTVRCIRNNDGASVHMGYCGTDQPKTHKICTLSSNSGSCLT
jgi:hypothetical protein